LLPEQDLKRKYGASWAFVTGASSGLGLAIAENLAKQGLNVVLCALDDALLETAHKNFVKKCVANLAFA
jgi:NADP-dependent 3-hydroxy acid dehydrogenase YdfG